MATSILEQPSKLLSDRTNGMEGSVLMRSPHKLSNNTNLKPHGSSIPGDFHSGGQPTLTFVFPPGFLSSLPPVEAQSPQSISQDLVEKFIVMLHESRVDCTENDLPVPSENTIRSAIFEFGLKINEAVQFSLAFGKPKPNFLVSCTSDGGIEFLITDGNRSWTLDYSFSQRGDKPTILHKATGTSSYLYQKGN